MTGYSFKLLPFLALFSIAFGAVYTYVGVRTILLGAAGWGGAIIVFGIAGMALGVALWRARRLRSRAVNPPAGTPGPR